MSVNKETSWKTKSDILHLQSTLNKVSWTESVSTLLNSSRTPGLGLVYCPPYLSLQKNQEWKWPHFRKLIIFIIIFIWNIWRILHSRLTQSQIYKPLAAKSHRFLFNLPILIQIHKGAASGKWLKTAHNSLTVSLLAQDSTENGMMGNKKSWGFGYN